MHIKRFEADTMDEALAEVRKTFGPDALILSSRTLRKGRGSLGLFSKQRVEVQAAAPRRGERSEPRKALVAPSLSDSRREPEREGMEGLVAEVRRALQGMAARQEFEDEIRGELRGLRFALDRRLGARGVPSECADPAVEKLMSRGLVFSQADRLCSEWRESKEESDATSIEDYLARRIEERLAPPRAEGKASIRVLVGAPGVGKTTTLAKLAARTEEGEGEIAMVSMDPYRIGAEAQLAQYAALLDSPFVSIDDPSAIPDLLVRHPRHRILVDTAGRSREIGSDLEAFCELRKRPGAQLSIEWVVDATARLEVQQAQLERFKRLSPDRLILTKIDECEDMRGPLNLLLSTDCPPLSWLGKGQRVPEDLEMAESARFQPGGSAWLQ